MTPSLHRLAVRLPIASSLASSAILAAGPAAALSCDPAHINYRVPPESKIGDLECDYSYPQGIYGIVQAARSTDPHGFD